MVVTVNGADRTFHEGTTVAGLVDTLGAPADGRGVAVAIEGLVVPRSEWAVTALSAGARIEVLVAVAGG